MKHKVTVQNRLVGIEATCTCGRSLFSVGRDESSRSSVKAWKTKHESEEN